MKVNNVRQDTREWGLKALDDELSALSLIRVGKKGRISTIRNTQTGRERTVEVRVTSSEDGWPTQATDWLDITLNHDTLEQENHGPKTLADSDRICILILLDKNARLRFFILKKHDLQRIAIEDYSEFMNRQEPKWKRPRKPDSFDCRPKPYRFEAHENQWGLLH